MWPASTYHPPQLGWVSEQVVYGQLTRFSPRCVRGWPRETTVLQLWKWPCPTYRGVSKRPPVLVVETELWVVKLRAHTLTADVSAHFEGKLSESALTTALSGTRGSRVIGCWCQDASLHRELTHIPLLNCIAPRRIAGERAAMGAWVLVSFPDYRTLARDSLGTRLQWVHAKVTPRSEARGTRTALPTRLTFTAVPRERPKRCQCLCPGCARGARRRWNGGRSTTNTNPSPFQGNGT